MEPAIHVRPILLSKLHSVTKKQYFPRNGLDLPELACELP